MKIWKYSGIFLIITGFIHTVFALRAFSAEYAAMLRNGIINSAVLNQLAFWFLVCGFILILLGLLLHRYIKDCGKPAPKGFSYGFLIFTVFGCVVCPVSGFWLLLPQALIMVFARKI